MTKKTRLIILLTCIACFLIGVSILVPYSMGYRFDFKKMRITATGGIYVRSFPAAEKIIIDRKITEKPGLFSNSIFVQSLLPSLHTVLVQKTGYYDYTKTIPVQEKQVTKLENILLFKKNIEFEVLIDKFQSPFNNQEKFTIKNGNLYYSSIPANSKLSAAQKATPVLKKITAFALQNSNIIWLGADGFLYKADLTTLPLAPTKITLTAVKISKAGSYKIIADDDNIFLISDNDLLSLNPKTNELENLYTPVENAVISPDENNIVYYNGNNIYISLISAENVGKVILYKSSGKITGCAWLNNYYIVFTDGDKIIISETDYRDNINTITLPQTIIISPNQKIELKNPDIFFNQQDGKLYILTGNTLLSSEKIIP